MGRNAGRVRKRDWRDLIKRQRRSGVPVAAFCREHQVSTASFYRWRARLDEGRPPREGSEVSFVPVAVEPMWSTRRSEFSLQLPNGVQVCIPHEFDAASLMRLLQVVATLETGNA